MTHAIVCGGRRYSDKAHVFHVLSALHAVHPFTRITRGDAPGADTLAAQWAERFGIPVVEFPANWLEHGRAAGAQRNRRMLREKPDLVIAFPGGNGTENMIRIAQKAGVLVLRV